MTFPGQARVLWADDQIDVARSLSICLAKQVHSVTFVEDGEVALEALRTNAFEIAITDLRMPPDEWGGLWLLHAIREEHIAVPVIVLSGEGAQSETIQALRLGAADYVEKHRAYQELPDRVDHVLGQSQPDDVRRLRHMIDLAREDGHVEFKASARCDLATGKKAQYIEDAILKTVAAFMNASGGSLLIGVTDDGSVAGLESDFAFVKPSSSDGFVNWLSTFLHTSIGPIAALSLRITIVEIESLEVCLVDAPAAAEPVFVRDEVFYVRLNNTTRSLTMREFEEYRRVRWP